MTTVAAARIRSAAVPEAFFAEWADMASWPDWNTDTDWVRLDGAFVEGATGSLKPKGGPKVRFVVERLVPGEIFVDVSRLFGARLTFDHRVSRSADDETQVDVIITITGPLRRLWLMILGKGLRESAQRDLDALNVRVEASATAR